MHVTRAIAAMLGIMLLTMSTGDSRGRTPSEATEPGYLSPGAAGFHHCALIYERPSRTADDLMPYVVRGDSGRPREWLFDAFLFLRFSMPSGARTDEGPTTWQDWLKHLDDWFARARDLHALDEAIERASAALGEPPTPRNIMLSIPYPDRSVTDFGLAIDGRPVNLSTEEGVARAVRAYVSEASRRFESAGFLHLRLWGFYWMREEISPSDEARVRAAAGVIHEAGFRLSWIPWWRAPGWDRWKECRIDAAILQPNYAFVTLTHGGSVRRNRLAAAADLARSRGLGVEIEAGDVARSLADRQAFLDYLADGGPDRLGYRDGACAYYLGTDTVEQTSRSPDVQVRRVYEALADFVVGKRVPDPEPPQSWKGAAAGFIGRLEQPARLSALDLLFDETQGSQVWQGRVEVRVRKRLRGPLEPAGWALRTRADTQSGRHQVITVPLDTEATVLEVSLHPTRTGMTLQKPRLIAGNVGPEGIQRHVASDCAYTTDLVARRAYDDDGTKLTDGIVPAEGFPAGKSVGWTAPEVAVRFDLGEVRRITRIEVACQGGSGSWVNWPVDAAAFLSSDRQPPVQMSGVGQWPKDLRWVRPEPVAITRRRSSVDMDGVLSFVVSPPVRARYVNLVLHGNGWIMLSEVRIMDGRTNLARLPGVRYTLRPLPTAAETTPPQYADDGVRLTDGIVARTFNPRSVVGWEDGAVHSFTVDLGRLARVGTVTVWSIGGGAYGIYAPKAVAVEGSSDGVSWTPWGDASANAGSEDGSRSVGVPYRLALKPTAEVRYVRVRVQPAGGWAMVSEIEVRR